jgi:hypothetical protein
MRLCLERILPPCLERAVKFALPPLESAADIAAAMKAVAAALADGVITPREGEAITRILDTFVPMIDANDFARRFTAIERRSRRRRAKRSRSLPIRSIGYST